MGRRCGYYTNCIIGIQQKGTIGLILPPADMPTTAEGVIPDIIINPHCLCGSTLITLSNREVKYIKDIFNEKKMDIKTVDPVSLKISNTKFKDGFVIKARELKQLTTISGRIIKCTPDHKFLVLNNGKLIWKETREIIPYCDKMAIHHFILPVPSNDGVDLEITESEIKFECAKEIKNIEPEDVYDFTTLSENHSFIANSFVSHNCIPSRMTIAQLKETVLGKVLLQLGMFGDGTSFGEFAISDICKELSKLGFQSQGNDILYNGMTGEQLESNIFIGPVFYQRLKHMVNDKEHSRAIGPMVVMTRQPAEGRARDGGLRFGEPFCQKVNMQIFASLRCGRQHPQIAGTSCIGS